MAAQVARERLPVVVAAAAVPLAGP